MAVEVNNMKSTFLLYLIFPTLYLYYLILFKALYRKRIRQNDRIDRYLAAERLEERGEGQAFSVKSLVRRLGRSLMRKDRSARLELRS